MPFRFARLPHRRLLALASILLTGLGVAGAAGAAEVVVKGEDLEGSVSGVTADGVEFQTIYGKGAIVIPWENVEALQSDKEFLVLYGDDSDAVGKLWGVEEGQLLVGPSAEEATRVPVDQIFRSLTKEDYEKSPLEAWRARYRYWNANFDLAFAYTDATTDSLSFATALEIERKKGPGKLFMGGYYRYGTTRQSGNPKVTNEDQIFGRLRYDHDIWDGVFGYGAISGEYNDIQSLSIRVDPNAGLGWRFWEQPKLVLAARVGFGYVYERYFGGNTNQYPSIVFGGDLDWTLPLGSKITGRAEYQPALTDWLDNYLIRAGADWTMPIIGLLDFKLTVLDQYNNRPAAGSKHNSFTSTAGLSFRF